MYLVYATGPSEQGMGGGAQILVEIIEAKPIPLSIRFLRRPKKLLTLLNNPMTMIEI